MDEKPFLNHGGSSGLLPGSNACIRFSLNGRPQLIYVMFFRAAAA